MAKKLGPVLLFLLLVFLLIACSPQSELPNLWTCKPSTVSPSCSAPTNWIGISPPTPTMQALYEDNRMIVFVNPDQLIAYANSPKLRRVKEAIEAGERLQLGTEDYDEAEAMIWFARSGSGGMAVYDKLRQSCVTSLAVIEKSDPGMEGTGEGASYLLALSLPDCTMIFHIGWMA